MPADINSGQISAKMEFDGVEVIGRLDSKLTFANVWGYVDDTETIMMCTGWRKVAINTFRKGY